MAETFEERAPRLSELDAKGRPRKARRKPDEPAAEEPRGQADELPPKAGGKKGTGAPLLILLVSLFWLFALSAGLLLVLFDPTGGAIRGPVLLFLNPAELPREEYYKDEILQIQTRELDLQDEAARLERLSAELDLREAGLDDRERDVEEREEEAQELLEQLDQLNQLGASAAGPTGADAALAAKTLEGMKPAAAALALEAMDFDTALYLMRLMKSKSLSAIFDKMPSELAAEFMDILGMPPEPLELD